MAVRAARRSRVKSSCSPLAVDLFSGCGGLTLGLKKAGFQVLAGVENDERAAATYRSNHPEVLLYERDIRKIQARELLSQLSLRRGQLDLLAGCPPCQGFSRLRRKNRKNCVRDQRNGLLSEFGRLIDQLLPKAVLLENVPSLIRHHEFAAFRRGLRVLGYSDISAVVDAADYGVPQRRRRLILLASRVHQPRIPEAARKRRTVRNAIKRLPPAGRSGDALHNMSDRRTERVRQIIRAIPKNGGSRTSLPEHLQLRCHGSFKGFYDVYGRMPWDDVAPTITSGCNNPSKGRFIHPTADRVITLREAAVLQGFPRSYKFMPDHGKESIALMIGNALPPPLVAVQAAELVKGLNSN